VKERDEMERLLNEAISTVDAAEREKKQSRSKQDNDSAQFQQRQERALRMAEEKLAQTMALLDDREEQVENLDETVKNLKSKMSVHQEGAHEAEEELDELHTENETLRHHVQTFEAQCAELKNKVSELEGESDKVSGLKVRPVDEHTHRCRCYNSKVR
jgi:chromosome segregation ATPase